MAHRQGGQCADGAAAPRFAGHPFALLGSTASRVEKGQMIAGLTYNPITVTRTKPDIRPRGVIEI